MRQVRKTSWHPPSERRLLIWASIAIGLALLALSATLTNTLRAQSVSDPALPTVRVNAGGAQHTDAQGNVWSADQEYTAARGWGFVETNGTGGWALHNINVGGSNEQPLFRHERWGMEAYRFNLPNGTYNVRLLFAETFSNITGNGQRVFDVHVQGPQSLTDWTYGPRQGSPKLW